jgi:hypothetical protein
VIPLAKLVVAARASARSLAAGPAAGEQEILDQLVERTDEIVPDGFTVARSEASVRVSGCGRTALWTPLFAVRSELPADERLKIVFESYAQKLQQVLTRGLGEPWPAPNSTPHADISDETVSVWWGEGESAATAAAAMRPIARRDLGI